MAAENEFCETKPIWPLLRRAERRLDRPRSGTLRRLGQERERARDRGVADGRAVAGEDMALGLDRRAAPRHAEPHEPDGLAGRSTPGPAMPVTDTARSTGACARAPSAIAAATSPLTAPWAAISAAGTPSISVLASFEYVTKPRSTTSDEPAISVSAAAIIPPVQDSAVASLNPRARQRSSTRSARLLRSPSKQPASDQQNDDGVDRRETSSIIVPKPPVIWRSAQPTGHGFQMSKRRNSTKAAA